MGQHFKFVKHLGMGKLADCIIRNSTILEWYKLDASHFDLMDEIDELIDVIITKKVSRFE